MRLISVGGACEVAFEIRMHTQKTDADFFDWLITPFEALIDVIQADFTGLLDAEDLFLQDDKNFVVNRRTGIKYGHVFQRDASGKIIEDFGSDLPRVTEIFAYLAEKFRTNARNGMRLGFVRRGCDPAQAGRLITAIETAFPELVFQLIAVNSELLGCSDIDERIVELAISESGPDGLGHPQIWADRLVEANLTDSPFNKTKDEVFNRLMIHQLGDVTTLKQENLG